ncbi:LysR family transcriptional regulator [Streptomyces solincola]|uniref:LysR family transcriptional regulator n=1 Tax=Streptomyces solincola TaxID=2100817 RepID=A0A2S9PYI9_9ACTN|nr:LysR family transcriptional regulator [Streptomyces solincola]PRH79490.1 LysR family transcriptional regulator [Streptomyces solincola]
MELRHLEHFTAVAEEGNVTRAAARLHLAQSGLSASLRALERDLGAELFTRSARGMELTEAGRALLVEARRTLAGAAAAREAVAAVRGAVAGALRVGAEQCMGAADPFGLLVAFGARHPAVRVEVAQAGSVVLLDRLRQGGLDVAFVAGPVDAPGVTLRRLARERLVLLCSPDHGLADGEGPLSPAELAGEPFVDLRPQWGARRAADAVFARAGVERSVGMELDDVHKLLEVVGGGHAVALAPVSVARKDHARGLVVRELDRDSGWEVAVARPDGVRPSAALRALLDLLDADGSR